MTENKTARDYFDQAAASWDEKPMRIQLARSVAEAIAELVPLSKDMTAIEFGCGTGLVTMALAPLVKCISAVDTSEKMLGMLEKKIEHSRTQNILTRKLDLLADELPDDRYDLAFTSMAAHHVKDIPHLLSVFHTMLNPGGWLAIADLDAEDGGFHGDIPDVFHNGFDRQEMSRHLEGAGFTGITSKTAHVIEKAHAHTGAMTRFPVFLIAGRKAADRSGPGNGRCE